MWFNPVEWYRFVVGLYKRLERIEKHMSQIDDDIAAFTATVESNFAAIAQGVESVKTGITSLDATIVKLFGDLGSSIVLSPNTKQLLAQVVQDSANLKTLVQGIDTTSPIPVADKTT